VQKVSVNEGGKLRVPIVRGNKYKDEEVTLRITPLDLTSQNQCHRIVDDIKSNANVREGVVFRKGETLKILTVQLADDNSGMLNLTTGVWQPERFLALDLEKQHSVHDAPLGEATRVMVSVLDSDDWPTVLASSMSRREIYAQFVWGVLRDNWRTEIWWLFAVITHAISAYVLDPLLLKWLLDLAIVNGDIQMGLQLALFKTLLIFVDQYISFHSNSNFGISSTSAIQWILYKFQSLPLDLQLKHDRLVTYRTILRRIDTTFTSSGYNTALKLFKLAVNVLASLIATYFLAPNNAMYLYLAYLFAGIAIALFLSNTVPANVHTVVDKYWESSTQFADTVAQLFNYVTLIACTEWGEDMTERALRLHGERAQHDFDMYYIDTTERMYASWIMDVVPIGLYASASVLVDFQIFLTGEVVAILSSFSSAKSNVIALCSMRRELKVAMDVVEDLHQLLCEMSDEVAERVDDTCRLVKLLEDRKDHLFGEVQLDKAYGDVKDLCLDKAMSLHGVGYDTRLDVSPRTSRLDVLAQQERMEAMRQVKVQNARGFIPLGEMYGFEQIENNIADKWRNARFEAVLSILAGVTSATSGVALVPPQVKARLVPRDPALVSGATLFENLTFAIDCTGNSDNVYTAAGAGASVAGTNADASEEDDDGGEDGNWDLSNPKERLKLERLLLALCEKLRFHEGIFQRRTLHMPMMQALTLMDSSDRGVLPILRQLLTLPDVLLIQDTNKLDKERSVALARLLHNFAAGHDLEGLAFGATKPKCGKRTVVWAADPANLKHCNNEVFNGSLRLVDFSEDNEITIVRYDRRHSPADDNAPSTPQTGPANGCCASDCASGYASPAPRNPPVVPPIAAPSIGAQTSGYGQCNGSGTAREDSYAGSAENQDAVPRMPSSQSQIRLKPLASQSSSVSTIGGQPSYLTMSDSKRVL